MSDPGHAADATRDELIARLEGLERELDALAENVRRTVDRLRGDIAHARGGVHELHAAAAAPPARIADEPPAARAPTPLDEPPAGGDAPEGADEGARLVALDLVTRGTGRDEALLVLADSFPGVDAAEVYDDAVAALGG